MESGRGSRTRQDRRAGARGDQDLAQDRLVDQRTLQQSGYPQARQWPASRSYKEAELTVTGFLTEAVVLDSWPMLTKAELRRARKRGMIGWYAFRGGPCYTQEQVQRYIDDVYLRGPQCAAEAKASSPSAATTSTSPTRTGAEAGTPAAMTPDLARSAAAALA